MDSKYVSNESQVLENITIEEKVNTVTAHKWMLPRTDKKIKKCLVLSPIFYISINNETYYRNN